jgi:hypothetical protein
MSDLLQNRTSSPSWRRSSETRATSGCPRQHTAQGEQGERDGPAPGDDPLDRPGDRQRSGPVSPMLSCSRTDTWRRGSASCRRTIRPAARSSKRGLPRRGIAICAHFSSPARWPSCARPFAWVTKLLGRMSAKQATIAIANKTARIAWAIMVHGGVYEAGHRPAHYRAEACAATGSPRPCGA